ncbi:MAG: DUF1634 domain-containing protein [Deltaproteobacteria bacterium]
MSGGAERLREGLRGTPLPRPAPTAPGHSPNLEVALGQTLRWGTVIVGALLAVALALALVDGGWANGWTHAVAPSPGSPPFAHLGHFWERLIDLEPDAVGIFALLVLLVLPPARVLLAAGIFFEEGDHRYLAFSLITLAIVLASNLLGIFVLHR